MKGRVDQAGRALLTLNLRATAADPTQELVAWVDTAFDGELVASSEAVAAMGLSQSAAVQATLADGSQVLLETFACEIEWFGDWRTVEVIANEGRMPLLGVGLLKGRKLLIDYQQGDLSLE